MHASFYRADAENGDGSDDPSDNALSMMIDGPNHTDNTFVVNQPDAEDPAWFASVSQLDQGGHEVELRNMQRREHELTVQHDIGRIAKGRHLLVGCPNPRLTIGRTWRRRIMLRRGEVWWADFGERRPVVLLSKTVDAQFRCMQIVEPAGIDITGVGLEVPLGAADGLSLEGVVRVAFPRPGLVPCTWLATVTEQDVFERIGMLSQAKLEQIEETLRLAGISSK